MERIDTRERMEEIFNKLNFKEVASYVCSRWIKKRKSGIKRKYTVVQTVVKGRKK